MKLLIISPNIKGFIGGVNRIQPPLGIGYLTSYLKNDHDILVYDTAIENFQNTKKVNEKLQIIGDSDENIYNQIQSFKPDVVCISVLFSSLMTGALNAARLAKKYDKNIKVLIGGNNITNCIKDYTLGIDNLSKIYDKNIDFYFTGESETSLPLFLKNFNKDIPGLCYFQDKKLVINKNSKFLDVENLKSPSWEYFSMEKYFDVGLFHSAQSYSNRVLPVMASRGCPEKCSFCSTPMTWGSKVRWKNIGLLSSEIKKSVEKYSIGEIQFQDDTITANLKYLKQLCAHLKEVNLPWCTPNGIKINYHQKKQYEMFKMMKDSGCYQITFGCESGSQRVLDQIIRKNTKVSSFKTNIKKAKDAGLFVHTFWIIGFPGESRSEMNETIKIASECEADSFSLAIYNPLPGTPLYHKVIRENLWWNESCNIENMTHRNSLVKVNGFACAEQVESFVDKQSYYLNNLLRVRDENRFKQVTKNRGVNLRIHDKFIHQT